MRRSILALACALATSAAAADWSVTQLFEALARERPGRAAFTEKKYLALLDRPVESAGELAFTPPDRMEKRTTTPRAESVVVEGGSVSLERGGKRQSLQLRENPAVAVLVESIRSTLAGDLAALTRAYSVGLSGSPSDWRLTLRPLDASAASLVERVEIAGREARVRSVEIFQADGDRSVMTIAPPAR